MNNLDPKTKHAHIVVATHATPDPDGLDLAGSAGSDSDHALKAATAFHNAMNAHNIEALAASITDDAIFRMNETYELVGAANVVQGYIDFWNYAPDCRYHTPAPFLRGHNRIVLRFIVSGQTIISEGVTYRAAYNFEVAACVVVEHGKVKIWHEYLDSTSATTATTMAQVVSPYNIVRDD